MDANGFTRAGERSSAVLFSTLTGAQRVVQVVEEARFGARGWVVTGDVAYGRSRPEGALAALELEGRSLVTRVGARYPLVRARGRSVDAGLRLEAIEQTNEFGFLRPVGLGSIPLYDESLRVLAFDLDGQWRADATPGLEARAGLSLRHGLNALGASEAGDRLLSRAEARPDFTTARLTGSARWTLRPGERISPYLQFGGAAQWAGDPLPAYEEFLVGNYTIGRGYDPGAASGDRALAAQGEAGVEFAGARRSWGFFAFADAARVWNDDRDGYDSRPWSTGAGARLRWRGGQAALTWAAPQTEALPGGGTPEPRVLLMIHQAFSFD